MYYKCIIGAINWLKELVSVWYAGRRRGTREWRLGVGPRRAARMLRLLKL